MGVVKAVARFVLVTVAVTVLLTYLASAPLPAFVPPAVVSCLQKLGTLVSPLYALLRWTQRSLLHRLPRGSELLLQQYGAGALSVLVVGSGLGSAAAGAVPSTVTAQGEAVRMHTGPKLFHSLGAITARLLLVRLFYREPFHNRRQNRLNRFCCSYLGFVLLVAFVALPNNVVDTGLLVVLAGRLSSLVYVPAFVMGQVARPYLVAAVRTCPHLRAAYTLYVAPFVAAQSERLNVSVTVAETSLWLLVLASVLFLASAHRRSAYQDDDDEE
ncbi:hypothetical protein STCU_06280 [Strigomonas culicis]|uniref:Uncharacterized protein n=1 Tax=Strigomonas culicis TaxID=28005 RepID=S9U5X9_9TRYP|nr:hypothetical protein STCU_06280 [Strigomonas culicis]|eukprot:EPY26182.1 hypothetical protein STCU_06280 [Strigomonas culicis]